MTPINIVRAEALFASLVQPSADPTPDIVRVEVVRTLRQFGIHGCTCRVATEFGEHPDSAATRMAWAIRVVAVSYPNRRASRNVVVRAKTAALS